MVQIEPPAGPAFLLRRGLRIDSRGPETVGYAGHGMEHARGRGDRFARRFRYGLGTMTALCRVGGPAPHTERNG